MATDRLDETRRVLEDWWPEPVVDVDELPAAPASALSAVLDLPAPVVRTGDPLPPLWHWLYFLDWPAQSALGADGHPAAGFFLPPIPDRRRMIAGGSVQVHDALELGVPATRTSHLVDVEIKQGGTGELVFVTVRAEIRQRNALRVVEEQDIVYRTGEDPRRRAILTDAGIASEVTPESSAAWQFALRPDPALLFRFSALTANAHRIHYDLRYAREVERYPDLVVHGPLLVLLMLELVRRNAADRPVSSLSYRLRRPVFAGEHVRALGDPGPDGAMLRIAGAREPRHATAEVRYR